MTLLQASKRSLALAPVFAGMLCAVLAAEGCRSDRRFELTNATPLAEQINARPVRQDDLTAVSIDLEITNANQGLVMLDVQRSSLGRTQPAYTWDWKGATASDVSILDITKEVQRDGVLKAWDVDVATPGTMRVKVWHEWDSEWRVTAESPAVSVKEGMNHLVLDPVLPVRAGDYVGLYIEAGRMKLIGPQALLPAPDLRDQSAANLAWATARSLQYNVAGDVGCVPKTRAQVAPNPGYAFALFFGGPAAPVGVTPNGPRVASYVPLTVLDLEKEVRGDTAFHSWEAVVDTPSTLRLKIWRQTSGVWQVVGQSAPERAQIGLNYFSLEPPVMARRGDYLGFFTDYPQSPPPAAILPFPIQVDTCGQASAGKAYVPGDFNGRVAAETMAHDSVGHYAFRAFARDAKDGDSRPLTLNLQPGRRVYRLPIPAQRYAADEMLTVTLRAAPGTTAIVHSPEAWLRPEYRPAAGRSFPRWPIDVLVLGLSCVGAAAICGRQRGRWPLVWIGLTALLAIVVWTGWLTASPLALLGPAIVVMLGLPGYLLLELAMPQMASRLDALERPPVVFGLSLAVWTAVAAVAYRAQWATSVFLSVLLGLCVFGLCGLAWRRRTRQVIAPAAEPAAAPFVIASTRAYRRLLVALILVVMVAVGWRAQFQGSGSDTVAHLAGYRKIADSTAIIGGNPLLGPGFTYTPNYAADPWYLAFGLIARLGRTPASVPLLYVCMASILTGLVFLAFYSLLKTFTSDALAAVLGTVIVIGPWLLGYAAEWKVFHSYFLEFLGYQSTFTSLIIFPMLTAFTLRFVRDGGRSLTAVVALFAFAAMGMHPQYIVWVPLIIGASLVTSSLPRSGRARRGPAAVLVVVIVCAAMTLAYLTLTGSLADKAATWNKDYEIGLWAYNAGPNGLWRPTEHLFSADPIGIFDHKAEIVGLLALLVLGGHRLVAGARSILLSREGAATGGLVPISVAAVTILLVPWLVQFNPLVASGIFYALRSSVVPISRIGGANFVFAYVALFGAVAIVWSTCIQAARTRVARLITHVAPLVLLAIASAIVWLSPSANALVVAPLSNQAWFPSLLNLTHDSLYRGLSALEPGVVAADVEGAEFVAALTPHYVLGVRAMRVADSSVLAQRAADNDAILNLSAAPAKLREILDRTQCRYVIVPKGSPALPSFRSSTLFTEAFSAESDVVFTVNRQ